MENNGSRDRTEDAAVFRGTGKEEKVTEGPRRLSKSFSEEQLEWEQVKLLEKDRPLCEMVLVGKTKTEN